MFRVRALLSAMILMFGCAGDDADADRVLGLLVVPETTTVSVNSTKAFVVLERHWMLSDRDVTAAATWTSSDLGIVVMNGPVATGVAKGTATINAKYGGRSGAAWLTVK